MLACRTVAATLGAQVVSEYPAIGGTTDPEVRQIVEELFREVDGGGITYVIVTNMDRLARRPGELARIVRRLSMAGARLTTTADPASAFSEQITLFCLVAKVNERRAA
jgi:DNA invertase Pin-like site-specific DNA recombinase